MPHILKNQFYRGMEPSHQVGIQFEKKVTDYKTSIELNCLFQDEYN